MFPVACFCMYFISKYHPITASAPLPYSMVEVFAFCCVQTEKKLFPTPSLISVVILVPVMYRHQSSVLYVQHLFPYSMAWSLYCNLSVCSLLLCHYLALFCIWYSLNRCTPAHHCTALLSYLVVVLLFIAVKHNSIPVTQTAGLCIVTYNLCAIWWIWWKNYINWHTIAKFVPKRTNILE